jgi:Divergent InlB B-repeat domain
VRHAVVLVALSAFAVFLAGAAGARSARALTQSLAVSVSGAGHVQSSPVGIACPKTCSATFKDSDTVTLTATADSGWQFSGWSGDCKGVGGCKLTMDVKHGVGATFKQPLVPPPPPAPGFEISSATPRTGDRVTFDATALPASDYRWDLNGDGVYERKTLRQPSVTVSYGQPGTYVVSVQTDKGAVLKRQIVVGGPAQPACGVYCSVTFPPPVPATEPGCLPGVSFGVVVTDGRCLHRRGEQYVTDAPVRVNGIDLYPTDGALIVLDPAAFTIANEGGRVTMQTGETQFSVGPLSWSGLDGTDGRATVFNQDARDLPGGALENFQVVGRIHLDLVAGGSAELATDMELPDILGDVTAHLLLHTDNANGLALTGLHIHLPTGWLSGKMPIQNLDLDYDAAEDSWGGGLTIQLPAFDYQLGGSFGMVHGAFDHASVELGGIDTHIADGVYLQAVRASVRAAPFGFGGGVTLSYGPKYRGVDLISGDGDFTIAFSEPAVFNFVGTLTVLSFLEIGDAYTTYSTDGNLHFGGELHRTWAPGVSMRAGGSGWVEGDRAWGMEGHGSLCLGACFGGELVASDAGLAMCGQLGIASIGFSYRWATSDLLTLGPACDLGPFRTASAPRPAFLAAGAGGVVRLPAGMPITAFAVRGVGAPPLVTLTAPGGLRVTTPSTGAGARTPRTLVFKSALDDTTYMAVASPPGGAWKIAAAAGSVPLVSIRNAAGLPKPSVSARVSGTGRTRVLTYRIKPLAGQRVVFVERGAKTAHRLAVASGARGSIHFVPGAGPAGRRRIVAVVTQNGLARATLNVAGYAAPSPLRVGRPGRLVAHRTKTALRFTWNAAPRAVAYRIDVRTSDHRHLRPFLRAHSYVVPRVAKGDRVTVAVVGLSASNRAGRPRAMVVVAR